ncbi:MAG: ABC transporter ATP-binding protein [Bacteroidota bacterium]
MEPVIELKNLVKDFGEFRAVNGLNLNVYKGDVCGFLGPNGAGKSTTIRMMLTLIAPTSGSISFFGKDIKTHRSEVLRKIGSIVEKPDFYKFLSAKKNLELLARISGVTVSKKKIAEVIELVGLHGKENEVVKTYSFGMKQRLGLAHALMCDPELIILDEPTTGLDPHGIIDFRNLINYLTKDKGITVFLSSHILSEIEMIATSMAIINNGKTVVQGTVGELMDNEKIILQIRSDNNSKVRELLQANFKVEADSLHQDYTELHGRTSDVPSMIRLLVENDINIYEVNKRTKLEDLFLQLTHN